MEQKPKSLIPKRPYKNRLRNRAKLSVNAGRIPVKEIRYKHLKFHFFEIFCELFVLFINMDFETIYFVCIDFIRMLPHILKFIFLTQNFILNFTKHFKAAILQ